MKTKIKWRLGELPTPSEVVGLLEAELLTKDEAREILISQETDEDRDKKSLQGEIIFLRELVQKLSNNRKADIVKEITVIERPYIKQPWFQPYYAYANTSNGIGYATSTNAVALGSASATTLTTTSGSNTLTLQAASAPQQFSAIKTF